MAKDMSKATNWGGARPNAGRKAPDGAKVTATFRISRQARERLRELKAQGVATSKLIEDFILSL